MEEFQPWEKSPNAHPLKTPQAPDPTPGLPIEERIAIAFPCLLVVSGRGPGVARVPAAHTGGCTWNGRSAVPLGPFTAALGSLKSHEDLSIQLPRCNHHGIPIQ